MGAIVAFSAMGENMMMSLRNALAARSVVISTLQTPVYFCLLIGISLSVTAAPPIPNPPQLPKVGADGCLIGVAIAGDICVAENDDLGFVNLALNPDAKASSSSVYGKATLPHWQTEFLNDGIAGNDHSWASDGDPSWAEIDLGDTYWIYKTAFGSDSTYRFVDRAPEIFSIWAATEYKPDTGSDNWKLLYRQEDGPPVHARREFMFSPVQARWLRVSIDKRTGLNARIDEIEIYGQKDPIDPARIQSALAAAPQQDVQAAKEVTEPGVDNTPGEIEQTQQYAILGEEHAWLKTYGRADLAGYLVPYNGRVQEYPRHVGDDSVPLPPLTSDPVLDGQLDDACWLSASKGVARVADPYYFYQTPLVENQVIAGYRDESLYLAVKTNRLLGGHIAVVSSGDWQGCGVISFAENGLTFNTYEDNGDLKQSMPIQGAFNRDLTCIEIALPLSLFPDCRNTGLRIGTGMGGRHTPNSGRPVNFHFASFSVAQQGECTNGIFTLRVAVPESAQSTAIKICQPSGDNEFTLKPGKSRNLTVPATENDIGPQADITIQENGGRTYSLHLFRYDPLQRTLQLAREMAERLAKKGLDVSQELASLKTFQDQHHTFVAGADVGCAQERDLLFKAHQLKRGLFFRDPDLALLQDILFIKRNAFQPSHIYTDYTDAPFRPGGAVCVLNIPKDNGCFEPEQAKITELFDAKDGIARNPVTDYERKKIYFGYRPSEDGYYHIMSMNADGTGLQQVTDGPFHDFYPCCLGDGSLAFISTRCTSRVFCFRGGSSVLFKMSPDGNDMQPLSLASLSEWAPAVMKDGRILWTRWEYIDKGADFTQTLWSIHPDGTHPELVYGNTIVQPNGYANGREVPGTNEISCTLVSHFGDLNGPIALLDLDKGRFNPNAISSLTPEVPWPGMWPREECFRDPIPLSRDHFLCAHAPRERFGLYIVDRFGNRELVYIDPAICSMYPTFFRPMDAPPVLRDYIDEKKEMGRFMVADVYAGVEHEIERGTVKYLRVVEEVRHPVDMLPSGEFRKDYAEFLNWYASPVDLVNGPFGWPAYVAKASLGLVPVEEDGSAHFSAPAGKTLYFQLLDSDFNELQRMRSMIQLQPGETRSCIGCHEHRYLAPPQQRPTALESDPKPLITASWEGKPLFFEEVVQPVLDAKCAGCHNAQHQLDFTGTQDEFGIPNSYHTLINKGLVHFVDCGWNSGSCEKLEPLTFGSVRSHLWEVLGRGHHDVTLTEDEMRRIKTWTDMNCPLWGDYLDRTMRVSANRKIGIKEP